ncbi:MAG TPA: hypothetical protein VFE45_00900 [Coriobacteriia bacterium]|nr:hypothetical protein [Coriobacteriia bacterium]
MNDLRDLIARASALGLLLSSDGLHLRVESVTREPVRAAFRAELLSQKAGLLACFEWRDEATEIVCAATRRLTDHYPIGYPTGSPEWDQADAAITDAYWSGDLAALREVVARYEGFAMETFDLYAAELKRQGEAGSTSSLRPRT